MERLQNAFTTVYSTNAWGAPDSIPGRANKKFYSGGGTDPENDRDNMYLNLLQSYVDRDDVKTVIEIGCGDWEVSSRIDWSSVQYTGYDVVEDLIKYNVDNYTKENIKFYCDSNIILENKISADLLIVKDVFQHLPPSFCCEFIKSIPINFKYNIITNDYSPVNNDIDFGGYTGNDFSRYPFEMNYTLIIDWKQKFVEAGRKITLSIN